MLVIVPTTRPLQVAHVVGQFRAQTSRGAELCLCPAPGALRVDDVPIDAVLLPGAATIGEARNAGLAYARMRGHEWAVFWDDDNYYGPGYLEEVERESAGADVLSKGIAFVRHDSGLWKYETPLRFFPGHSTAVRVRAAAEFPAASLSEDVEWSRRMFARGACAKHLPPWGLVYDRRSPEGHAYDASEVEFLRAHGPARGPFLAADDSATNDGGPWTRAVLGGSVVAQDEAVFRALEKRASRRLGRG